MVTSIKKEIYKVQDYSSDEIATIISLIAQAELETKKNATKSNQIKSLGEGSDYSRIDNYMDAAVMVIMLGMTSIRQEPMEGMQWATALLNHCE